MTGSFVPKSWYWKPCMEYLKFMEEKLAPGQLATFAPGAKKDK